MSTNESPRDAGSLALSRRPILLATDGSDGSLGALTVALALASDHGAIVHVVHVVDTRSAAIPPPLDLMVAMGDAVAGPAVHDEQKQALRAALSTQAGLQIDWPLEFLIGNPATTIVHEARRIHAALIVVGLRKHGKLDRVVNDETAHKVMQHADCPVLGVVVGTTALPSRVLVALDFSKASLLAAHAARMVAHKTARLSLVYVAPSAVDALDEGELLVHKLGLESAFTKARADLGNDASVDRVVLHPEQTRQPAEVILTYAEGNDIDLIAAGSARHALVERWLLGSVSAALVHDGRRSVLIVPPRRDSA